MPAHVSPEAFRRRDAARPVVSLSGETMGTTWSARIVSLHTAGALRPAIERALAGVIAEMSHWSATSVLSRFNRAALGNWHDLPPDFAYVLAAGLDVARISGGAFDPASGRLTELWGFGPPGGQAALPDEAALATLTANWQAIELDGARARRVADVTLDLSGIAKGFAVDAAARTLRALGATDFLVEIGGELLGSGVKPSGEPWWVTLEEPPGASLPPFRVALHGLAVATSGDYRRFATVDGRQYAHTIDPRTRRPIDNQISAVTILHPSGMLADAFATAITVLGEEAGMEFAVRHGLAARIIARDREPVRETLSPALEEMLA